MTGFTALVLSLPTRHSTLRMRIWRALKESGGGVLRDGVYLLPAGNARDAILAGLEAGIRADGGFAMTLSMEARDEAQAAQLEKLFDRGAEYAAFVRRIEAARSSLSRLGARRAQTELRRLERALEKLAAIDFFPGEAKLQATAALGSLKSGFREMYAGGEPRASRRGLRRLDPAKYRGRVWATRKSPWVDRLACAWLIRRFIDREARFEWIARPSECPKKAVGYDFDGAEFTHVGNHVTYEVLVGSFGLDEDPALVAIGASVHFLDVGGIPVADAGMLETFLKGAREKARSDDALVAESSRIFDLLYSGYRAGERQN